MDIEDFFHKAQHLLEEKLHALIHANAPSAYAGLFDAARYSLFSGGKRLRPLLTLAAAHTFQSSFEKALHPACALELVHTYSLIHDDLPCMDDDDLRRGKPTLHRVYPEWHALLTGDYLLTFAFEVIAQSPALSAAEKIDLVHILASRAGAHGMIGGQMIDLLSENTSIDKEMLELMHINKTAALISAALEFGAVIAGASQSDRAILKDCGVKIGLAFQITDDILDASPSDSDKRENKTTAVSLLGEEEAHRYKQALLSECLAHLKNLSSPTPLLQALFVKLVQRQH